MDGFTISKVAELTGFSPSALRFYETAGLINPARTPAGYRSYDAASVETLRFIARAKRLGLTLDEIGDLVTLLDDRRCAPVQERLRTLLTSKITEAHQQITTLEMFTAQLRRAAARLDGPAADGPCDDDCGCTTDPADPADRTAPPVAQSVAAPVWLSTGPTPRPDVPIACTLSPEDLADRLADWRDALSGATSRTAIPGGLRVRLPRHTPLTPLAALVEAEQACCGFFTFTLAVTVDEITLDITGPRGTEAMARTLGAPSGAPVTPA